MLEKKKKSVDTLQEETDLMEVLSKLLELEKEKHKVSLTKTTDIVNIG